LVYVIFWNNGEHADSHVESFLGIRLRHRPFTLNKFKDRGGGPRGPVNVNGYVLGKYASKICCYSSAGDMTECVHLRSVHEC